MATVEVITNPTAVIGTAIVILISATALAFLVVLFLFGFNSEDIKEAED